MSGEATQVSPDTSTPAPQTSTPAPVTESPAVVETPASTAPATSGLDFIPESFKEASWAKKYTTAEDFFKGVDHMSKMMGQKQVVEGIKPPGENASEEEYNNFYKALGRPEAADKYAFPEDVKGYEGMDIETEKKGFAEIAFKLGLNQKQADAAFKTYIEKSNAQFAARQEQVKLDFDKAVVQAFGNDFKASLDQAKRGAKALGNADTLTLEELRDPLTLKALAKLGEYVGEDNFVETDTTGTSKESLLQEARRLQASPEYMNNDKATHEKVAAIYKKVYPK